MAKLQAIAVGVVSAVVAAVVAGVAAKCPDLVDSLPQILLTGVLAGVAKYAHSGRSQP